MERGGGDLDAPFTVFGRNSHVMQVGFVAVVMALIPLGFAWLTGREIGWLSLSYFVFMGLLGAFLFAAGLRGLEMIADEKGIAWRTGFASKFHSWADIESVGSGHSRVMEPADHVVGRMIVGYHRVWPHRGPIIGINLKLAGKDAGTAAYRRGFTGYDINLSAKFELPVRTIIDALQARLEWSRRN